MINSYLRTLYQDAMQRAYAKAFEQIGERISPDSRILDCGAGSGETFKQLASAYGIKSHQYAGLEWSLPAVELGRRNGLDISAANLNQGIDYGDSTFSDICALSVLEHLINPCRFLNACLRVLQPGGRLILLTPNISTYFTAALILAGKMPSSGPHPDSDQLLKGEELFKVSADSLQHDTEVDTPVHRHMVIFSYRVLRKYLRLIGFTHVKGWGYGFYPLPRFVQPLFERMDPFHCHQMVFVAVKEHGTSRPLQQV